LRAARDTALLIQNATLDDALRTVERNGICKVEIGAGLDDGEIHTWHAGIGNDLLYLGDGEIATCVAHLRRFQIDDPIADARLNAAEILRRELVSLSGAVIVDGIGAMEEDGEGHQLNL
jgi:hypothetical protein